MTDNIFIKGMHCFSCAILIEGGLTDVPGVEFVKVDLELKKAIVVYDENLVNRDDLISAVEKLGNYQVEGIK